MNRIEKLNEQSDLFHNDKELISLDNEVTPNLVVSSSTSYENSSSNPNEQEISKLTPQQVFGRTSKWMFKAHWLENVHEKPVRIARTQSNEGEIILSNNDGYSRCVNLLKKPKNKFHYVQLGVVQV